MNKLPVLLAAVLLTAASAGAAEVHPLLPDDATTIAFVNLRQMVDLPPAKPHAEAMLDLVLSLGPDLKLALLALGVKPLEDIDTLTIGAQGLGTSDRTLIVTGRFDRQRIQTCVELLALKEPGRITTTKVGDTTMYEDKVGRDLVYSSLLDSKTLLFSMSKDLVMTAAKGGVRKPKLSPELVELIGMADDKRSVWAVFLKPEELFSLLTKELSNVGSGPFGLPLIPPLPRTLQRLPRTIDAAACQVGIDKDINVDMLLRTSDKDKAELVADLFKVLQPGFKLMLPRNRLLGRERGEALATVLLEGKANTDKGDVTVAFQFANEQLRVIMTPRKP